MEFHSVEDAYMALAKYLQGFVEHRKWEITGCHMQILSKMARGSQWLVNEGKRDENGGYEHNQHVIWDGLDAAIYLRDNILATTGQRIWGLTFTLYPTGKFNIEYDYNKPEGYDETDEVITGDEINRDLDSLK